MLDDNKPVSGGAFYKKLYTDCTLHKCFEGVQEQELYEIEMLSYDRDKYCKVLFQGREMEIKSGYIYKSKEKSLDKYGFVDYKWACPYRHLLSNKDYREYRKKQRKEKSVSYSIYCVVGFKVVSEVKQRSLKKSLVRVRQLKEEGRNADLTLNVGKEYCGPSGDILSIENDEVFISKWPRINYWYNKVGKRQRVKARHLLKHRLIPHRKHKTWLSTC